MSGSARGYSWPAFEVGNQVSLRHGARSPRVLEPIAERLTAELMEVAPWATRPPFAGAVKAWAWAEARCQVLRAWVDEHALLSEEGRLASGELARAEAAAAAGRDRLALNPMAMSKLLVTFSQAAEGGSDDALEQLRAEGRRIVEARTAALATVTDDQESP